MVEFTITGEELWNRMARAVEKVNERLRKTVNILEDAKVPYAVIELVARASDFRTVPLETLVRMKLNAFRDKDRVHLRDMISLGLIDDSWPVRYPSHLCIRLEELLKNPDG